MDFPDSVPVFVDRGTMEGQLRRTVIEVLGETQYSMNDRLKAFFPSTSANYINNRMNAGAVGTFLEDSTLLLGLRTPGGTLNVNSDIDPDEQIHRPEDDLFFYDSSELKDRFSQLWFRVLKRAQTEEKVVKAVGLPEALKVRTITKGPPYTYTALRPLWKKLHSVMREQKTFLLIGTPNTELELLKILGNKLGEDQVYLSGDYKGATNNLYSWVSEVIADQICKTWNLSEVESQLFHAALTHHVFDHNGERLEQEMGQLMGSIMSFPVLCLANAAMSRWAMEVADKRVWKLTDAPLGVNGDDVCLRADRSVYQYWREITRFGGLEESVGKTFVDREFVTINSMMYERTPEEFTIDFVNSEGKVVQRRSHLREVPHLNMGLILGNTRSGGKFNSEDLKEGITFGTRARDLLDHCPVGMRSVVYTTFLDLNREVLQSTRLPWFIPEWLGGLGLPIYDPLKQCNSQLDLSIARRIIMNWSKVKPVSLGQQGSPWAIRRLTSEKVPETHVTSIKDQSVDALGRVNGLLAVDLLFDSNFKLHDLYNDDGNLINSKGALNHNARLWKPEGEIPKPIEEALLYGEHRYEGLRVRDIAKKSKRYPAPPTIPDSFKIRSSMYDYPELYTTVYDLD
jgi:hypothetical protein